jgi:hypothetical protein
MNRILFGRTVRGILGGDSIPGLFIPHLIELYPELTTRTADRHVDSSPRLQPGRLLPANRYVTGGMNLCESWQGLACRSKPVTARSGTAQWER